MRDPLAELERAWLAEPEDQARLATLIAATRRAGRLPRPAWLQARTFPPAELRSAARLQVGALLESGAMVTIPRDSDAPVYRIPRHRFWWIELDSDRPLRHRLEELKGQAIAGLALRGGPLIADRPALGERRDTLRYLDLAQHSPTASGVDFLATLRSLEALNLEDGELDRDTRLAPLHDLQLLQRLSLRRLRGLRAEDVAALSRLPELYELDLTGTGLAAAGLRKAISKGGGRNLTRLSLLACALDFESDLLAALATLPELLELNLRQARLPGDELPKLAGAARLRRLNLAYQTELDDAALLALADLPALAELDLSCCDQVTDQSADALAGWPRLRRLGLLRTSVGPAWIKALARLPELRELDLENVAGVDDEGLIALAESPSLQRLNLACCPAITAEGVRALTRMPALVELDITACPSLPRSLRDELLAGRPKLRLRGPGRNQRD